MLSMVSKTIGNRLINHISTPSGNRRLLVQDFHNLGEREGASVLEHYKSLGDPLLPAVTIRAEPRSGKRFLLLHVSVGKTLRIRPRSPWK